VLRWILLFVLGLGISFVGADDAKPAAKPVVSYDIPYRLIETKHVLIRIKLNNKGPFNFIVDTGAPALFMSKKAADKAGVANGKDGLTHFNRLELEGGLVIDKAYGRVEDLFQLEGMNGLGLAGCELHGVIGYNLLAKYRITYDFTSDKLVWTPVEFEPPPLVRFGKGGGGAAGGLEMMGSMMKMMGTLMGAKADPTFKARGSVGITFTEANGCVTITAVLSGSPAADAGLQVGDIIKSVRNRDISDIDDLRKALAQQAAGQKIAFAVQRGTMMHTIDVTLGKGL
jgi:hypothetical protein